MTTLSDGRTKTPKVEVVPDQTPSEEDVEACRYTSKRCMNPRAWKKNGKRHSLCTYHRTKANLNQQRLAERRRIKRTPMWLVDSTASPPPRRALVSRTIDIKQRAPSNMSVHVAIKIAARLLEQAYDKQMKA